MLEDVGLGVEGDDHGLVGALAEQAGLLERLDERDGFELGAFEARDGVAGVVGLVERLAAGGVVDEDDVLAAGDLRALDLRLCDGEQGGGEDEQLQEQEEVSAELLEGCVGLEVFDGLLPEQGGRDFEVASAELEEVENDQCGDGDPRGDAAEHGREPGHRKSPFLRMWSMMRVSISVSVETVRSVISRRAQNWRS